jgi:hypothetical protein
VAKIVFSRVLSVVHFYQYRLDGNDQISRRLVERGVSEPQAQ